jgi:hypothetical protein
MNDLLTGIQEPVRGGGGAVASVSGLWGVGEGTFLRAEGGALASERRLRKDAGDLVGGYLADFDGVMRATVLRRKGIWPGEVGSKD